MRRNAVQRKTFSPISTYEQIENDIRARISCGDWAVGSLIPSRRELAKKYNVNLRTLQRAISALLDDGTLRAEGTRGTSVARTGRTETDDSHAQVRSHARLESEAVLGRAIVTASIPPHLPARAETTIGLIGISQSLGSELWDFSHFSVLPILQALERVLAKTGSASLFFDRFRTDQPPVPIEVAVASLLDAHVDALVVIDLHNDPYVADAINRFVPNLPVPLVYVSGGTAIHQGLHICHENWSSGYVAAQHLLRQGLSRLVFFAAYSAEWAEIRYAGAQAAVAQAGLPPETLCRCPPTPRAPDDMPQEQRAYEVACAALKAGLLTAPGVDPASDAVGIIAANDFTAYGFLRAASEAGLAPGVDFAILGFDDAPPSRTMGLTTLRRPLEAMGEEAAFLVQRALADRTLDMEVRLRMHLIPRASTQIRNGKEGFPC